MRNLVFEDDIRLTYKIRPTTRTVTLSDRRKALTELAHHGSLRTIFTLMLVHEAFFESNATAVGTFRC